MKKVMPVVIPFVLASLLVISLPNATMSAEKVITLKLGTHWPKPHLMTPLMESWMKDIEDGTKGKVKIKYFPADQLSSLKDALEKMSSGVAEMGNMNPEYYPAQFPLAGAMGLPFAFSTAKQGTMVMNELTNYFEQEFQKNKLKLLWGFTPPAYLPITVNKPIYTLADWKGLRFRSGGGTQAQGLEALGSIPIVVHTSELYSALQRGTVDGALFPLSAAASFKLEEVGKYVTDAALSTIGMSLCMNLKTWNSLSKDIQSAILAASAKAAEVTGRIYTEKEAEAFKEWEKKGVKIYVPSKDEMLKWKKAVEPVWAKWIAENEAKGLPSKKLAEEIISRAKKYE